MIWSSSPLEVRGGAEHSGLRWDPNLLSVPFILTVITLPQQLITHNFLLSRIPPPSERCESQLAIYSAHFWVVLWLFLCPLASTLFTPKSSSMTEYFTTVMDPRAVRDRKIIQTNPTREATSWSNRKSKGSSVAPLAEAIEFWQESVSLWEGIQESTSLIYEL